MSQHWKYVMTKVETEETLEICRDIEMTAAKKQRAEDRKNVATSKPFVMKKFGKSSMQDIKIFSRQGFLCHEKPSRYQ